MSNKYHSLYTRGDFCLGDERMIIRLYPNTSNELSHVKAGSTLTSAIRDAADQLYEAGVISYYDIQRFHAEKDSHFYPGIPKSEIEGGQSFKDYLLGTSDSGNDYFWCSDGSCDSLKSRLGCHMLVHDYGCNATLASAEGGIDDCSNGGSAFSRGVMAWTSVGCEKGLVRNSGIQEPLHQFIRADQSDVKAMLGDDDGDGESGIDHYDEHSLGLVDMYADVTPMLTYHDNEFYKDGDCWNDKDIANYYTTELTQCTIDAVGYTVRNACDPQNMC